MQPSLIVLFYKWTSSFRVVRLNYVWSSPSHDSASVCIRTLCLDYILYIPPLHLLRWRYSTTPLCWIILLRIKSSVYTICGVVCVFREPEHLFNVVQLMSVVDFIWYFTVWASKETRTFGKRRLETFAFSYTKQLEADLCIKTSKVKVVCMFL